MKGNKMPTLSDRKQNRGFTLAELLVVVAIIGVLVAVSIPIFTSQLAKAKLATNQANIRAAKAAASADYINSGISGKYCFYDYEVQSGRLLSEWYGGYSGKFIKVDANKLDAWKGICALKAASCLETNGLYSDIIVLVSDSSISTCPYYDAQNGTIKYDTFQ